MELICNQTRRQASLESCADTWAAEVQQLYRGLSAGSWQVVQVWLGVICPSPSAPGAQQQALPCLGKQQTAEAGRCKHVATAGLPVEALDSSFTLRLQCTVYCLPSSVRS